MSRPKGSPNKSAREHAQDAVISTLKATIKTLREQNKQLKAAKKK